uniref:Uncharacterized protein n=1 Tax=Tanacetum cinerariifolium TaxID=118510 RepID=A0A6L2N122_TANCI|nr:hypothetical protein [Tanacetum cinerariifolium]
MTQKEKVLNSFALTHSSAPLSLEDKIICDLNKTPDLFQEPLQNYPKCGNPVDGQYCQGCALLRKKFKEDMFTCCIENEILQDSSEPSNDNANVVNAPQEPFIVKQDPDPGKNSSQSPPQINHHCCYGCGDPLEDIFCHQCTCELCGKGAHYGYNCPSKVSIVPNPEPFNNQTVDELPQTLPSFDPTCYSEDGNSFTYDSTSNLVHDSLNVFDPPPQPPLYSCEFYGNDARYGHYCTPQVSFIYPKPCYKQDFNFPQDFHDFQQHYLCCENCGDPHEAYQCQPMNKDYYHEQNSCYDPNSSGFDQFQPSQYTVNHPIFNAQSNLFNSQNKLMEQLTSMCDMVPVCYDDDDDEDYTITITPKEPNNSLSMGNEHLDTISETKSDEFIKSSVENLVPNPSESEESLLNHDSSIISSSSKIDSLFDEFAGELTLLKSIPPGIKETDCDPEGETRLIKRLLNDSLLLPENESFHFDIPSSSRPPAKPPDGNSGILNVKVMGDISEHKVPMPRLMFTQTTLVPNQEKSPSLLSHRGHEAFQPSIECLMMLFRKNTPILDVLFSISNPLDKL